MVAFVQQYHEGDAPQPPGWHAPTWQARVVAKLLKRSAQHAAAPLPIVASWVSPQLTAMTCPPASSGRVQPDPARPAGHVSDLLCRASADVRCGNCCNLHSATLHPFQSFCSIRSHDVAHNFHAQPSAAS